MRLCNFNFLACGKLKGLEDVFSSEDGNQNYFYRLVSLANVTQSRTLLVCGCQDSKVRLSRTVQDGNRVTHVGSGT